MSKVRMMLVGGFLGAGKTTLLAQAAERLMNSGQRVGLITNDQAAELVDTELLRDKGFGVSEISGGCFCCKFENLVSSARDLIGELRPDVLIGEPVGSCTDLSATVLQPLKKLHGHEFSLAPFSVVADPLRLRECLHSRRSALPDSVMYVVRKQIEEADVLVLNKIDMLSPEELLDLKGEAARNFPHVPVIEISALTGKGVDEWLKFVAMDIPAGRRIVEVDYDTYAEGEAVLGWLNVAASLHGSDDTDWRAFLVGMVEMLRDELDARSAEIAHLKARITAAGEAVVANLTSTSGRLSARGSIHGSAPEAHLTLNARVHIAPEKLLEAAAGAMAEAAGDGIGLDITEAHNFSPARPRPTHRFDAVV